MNASEVTRRLRDRAIYASFSAQRNRISGGCSNQMNMTNISINTFESSLIPLIKDGDIFTTQEQRDAIIAASTCQTSFDNDVYMIGTFYENPLEIYDKNGNLINNSMNNIGPGSSSIFLARFNSSNELQWITRIGSSSSSNGQCTLIVKDAIYISFNNSIFYDNPRNIELYNQGSDQPAITLTIEPYYASYNIAKYSLLGDVLWATHIDVPSNIDCITSLTLDSLSNIYISMIIYGETNNIYQASDNSTIVNTIACDNNTVMLVKYTTNGEYIWSTHANGSSDYINVVCDRDDNVYMTSSTDTDFEIFNVSDQSTVVATIPLMDGNWYNWIIKYDSNGVYLWANRFGGSNDAFKSMIAIDSQNNLCFMGVYCDATVSIFNASDLNNPVATLPNSGSYDIGIIKYNSNGVYLWGTHLSGPGTEREVSIAVDKDDNIIALGRIDDSPSIDIYDTTSEYSIKTLTFSLPYSIILVKYTSNGEHIWSTYASMSEAYYFTNVQSDYIGNIIVSAAFDTPTVDLYDANGSIALTLTQQGSTYNTYTAIYNSDGTPMNANVFINTDFNNISTAYKPYFT